MAEIDIMQQLKARFSEPLPDCAVRRIVVWNDPEGEFAEAFAAMVDAAGCAFAGESFPGGPVQCVEVRDGNTFAAKRRVCREAQDANFLLYRRRAQGELQGDWLADIELYAEHFHADYSSMLLEQIGAVDTDDVRDALRALRAFFAAKDRIAKFVRVMPHATSAQDVERGVIAVCCGAASATAENVVRAYMIAAAGNDGAPVPADKNAALQALRKYGAEAAFRTYLHRVLGYEGDIEATDDLAAHLLISALAATMPPESLCGLESHIVFGNSQFCVGIVRDWATSRNDEERRVLHALCRRVEERCNLLDRFLKTDIAVLAGSDVFPAIDEAILRTFMNSFAEGVDRRDEALSIIRSRKEASWYAEVASFYACLGSAVDIQGFYHDHATGLLLSPAAEVWRAYTEDWWRMDGFYRAFCDAYSRCVRESSPVLDDSVRALASWVDGVYRNWFLSQSISCWVSAAQASWEKAGWVDGVPRQDRFYDDVVTPELNATKRVLVVVSDAMRYEVAQQLAQRLERERSGSARVDAMQAVFPSVTEFGMAALLPHRSLSYDWRSGDVLADGASTEGIPARSSVLVARNPKSVAIQAVDLVELSKADRKALVHDAEVVFVYHNVIDTVGHNEHSGQSVIDACEDCVEEVMALVKIGLNDLGVSRAIVTADHGFLYTRQDLTELEKVGRDELAGEARVVERRFLIADPDATSDVFVRMNNEALDGGESSWWAPRECLRLKCSGSMHYVHGGVSLQELCVPVVRFRKLDARSKDYVERQRAALRLVSTDCRITSMNFGIALYQPEPVSGKVEPCEYELVFTDASGNEISDRRSAHADSASQNEQERTLQVRFALKAGLSYPDECYLVAREGASGSIAWREPYRILIAFAPADDFGF